MSATTTDATARTRVILVGLTLTTLVSAVSAQAKAPVKIIPNASYLTALLQQAERYNLAESSAWHALLHYTTRWFGGHKSEADGAAFFNARNGKTDPRAELRATLRRFFDPPMAETKSRQHPQCRFPARFAWLSRQLAFDPQRLPRQPCPRFWAWRDNVNAGGATLVYAAAYLNNPASMFGHTFLRIDKRGLPATDLLSYIFNYSATLTTTNAVLYSILGLTGGFDGRFAIMPYYLKVNEYSALENRDLWEYRLRLNQEEIDLIVMHAWELGGTHFDYFYLDENCSYHILSLLQLVRPQLKFRQHHRLLTVPVDTLRTVMAHPQLVDSIRLRPSLFRRMRRLRAALNAQEAALAAAIADDRRATRFTAIDRYPPERRALMLEAAVARLEYRRGSSAKTAAQRKAVTALATEIQVRRSMLHRVPPLPPIVDQPPHLGHASTLIRLGFGATRQTTFTELWLRPSLHDLLGAPLGYDSAKQIEMVALRLRFDSRRELLLEQVDLVRIISLAPLQAWITKPSWQLRIGSITPHEQGCSGWKCIAANAEGGPGLTLRSRFFAREQLYFGFVDFSAAAGNAFVHDYRLGVGASAGTVVELASFWRLSATISARYHYLGVANGQLDTRLEIAQSFRLERNLELRSAWMRSGGYDEGNLWLGVYF